MPLPVPTSRIPTPSSWSAPRRPASDHRWIPASARRVVGCSPVPNAWPGSIVTTASPASTACSLHGGRITMRPIRVTGNSARQVVSHSSAGMARTLISPISRSPSPLAAIDANRASSPPSSSAAVRFSTVSAIQARMRTGALGSCASGVASPPTGGGTVGSALVPAGASRARRSLIASADSGSQVTESSSQPPSLSCDPRHSPERTVRAPRAALGSASSAPRRQQRCEGRHVAMVGERSAPRGPSVESPRQAACPA